VFTSGKYAEVFTATLSSAEATAISVYAATLHKLHARKGDYSAAASADRPRSVYQLATTLGCFLCRCLCTGSCAGSQAAIVVTELINPFPRRSFNQGVRAHVFLCTGQVRMIQMVEIRVSPKLTAPQEFGNRVLPTNDEC
jgi:hypothetical protein